MTLRLSLPFRPSARAGTAWMHPLTLAILAAAVFGSCFTHGFTNWDDPQYIVENPLIRGFTPARVLRAFTSFSVHNYNPLHIVSYMVDHALWGLHPAGFFLQSLILHILGSTVVYFLALRWVRSPSRALLAAAIFAVHPVRVESVAWFSERKDLLSGLFGAGTLLLYWKRLDGGPVRLAVLAWFSFLLALLSKSQLVTLPLVLLAMDVHRGRPLLRSLPGKVPFLLLSGIFTIITFLAHTGEAGGGARFPDSILVPLAALPRYLLHIIWPVGLSPYYDFPPGEFQGLPWLVGGGATLAILAAALVRSYRGKRTWFLGIVWLLVLLAPVIGFFRLNVLLADRYLQLAMLGPVLAAAASVPPLGAHRRTMHLAAAGAVLVLSILSAQYAAVFSDSESLWRAVLRACPGSSLAFSNLGHHLLGCGRLEEAAISYDADLAEKPYFESSILGRALIHQAAGENDDARRLHEIAIEKRPSSVLARLQYADFLEARGDREAALGILLGLDPPPAHPGLHGRISDLALSLGRTDLSLEAALRAVDLAPFDALAWHRAGKAREATGDAGRALASHRRALELAPGLLPAKEAALRLGGMPR